MGWSLVSAVQEGIMPPHLLTFALGRDPNTVPDETVAQTAGAEAVQQALNMLPPRVDRTRFEAGFEMAWNDAKMWWYHPAGRGAQPATVGYRKMMCHVRLAQYQAQHGASQQDWAFDHGYLAALDTFDRFLRGI